MDRRERWDDPEEALRVALDSLRYSLATAMPCVVVSYNSADNTIQAQPLIKFKQFTSDTAFEWVTPRVLVDVPVAFARGGGFTCTMPIAEGDECLVVFASRDIDNWFTTGKVSQPGSSRSLSISDGFAIVGPTSRPNVIPNISSDSAQLRSDDGECYVEVKNGHLVNIVAPGGINLNGVTIDASGNVAIPGSTTGAGEGTFNGGHTVSGHVHSDPQGGNVGSATG